MIDNNPIFVHSCYELTPLKKESKTRLGVISLIGYGNNPEKKLIGDIAAERIKDGESFFQKIKHFIMLKTKRWVQFPDSNILVNVNSAAKLLRLSKEEIYDTSKLKNHIKNFRTATLLNSFKTTKISESIYKKIFRFSQFDVKTPDIEGLNFQLRFNSANNEIFAYEIGEKPYVFREELDMTYLFQNVWIVKDKKSQEYYIDFGDDSSIHHIQGRAFWDIKGIPHNSETPTARSLYTQTIEMTPEEIICLKSYLINFLKK